MTDEPDLASLLGSRICHDLISPLGAIGNGVELMMLDGGRVRPELALIAQSVASANARVRFLRIAFGSSGRGQQMGQAEIGTLLRDWTEGGRLRVDWQVDGDVDRPDVRRAFLALLCLETALPTGGNIIVTRAEGRWRFTAGGRRLRADPSLWAVLEPGGAPDGALGAAHVQFGLLHRDLRLGPGMAAIDVTEDALTLSWADHAGQA